MPELLRLSLDIVLCMAEAATLDRLVPPGHGARLMRTAPDELLIVAPTGAGTDVVREVAVRVAALEPDALTLDVTDGWAAWELRGRDAIGAFATLSALEPPTDGGWVQGDVARVGAKVLGGPDGALSILVPAYQGEHLRRRADADAGAVEVAR